MDTPSCDSPQKNSERVIFPENAESILAIALTVIGKHQSEGVNSPLKNQIIADLHYKTTLAKAKHDEGMKYLKLMEEAFAERNYIVGSNAGTSSKGNTITDILSGLAQVLVESDSRQLMEWGFTLK